jgi:hypothetical protein
VVKKPIIFLLSFFKNYKTIINDMQNTATKTKTSKNVAPNFTKNIVQFRRNFVNLPSSGENNKQLAVSIMSELLQFGYVLTPEAVDNIAAASRKDAIAFHDEVIGYLKFITGSGRSYRPFWPGFPEQVMEQSEVSLWIHQLVYYFSNATYEPTEWTKARPTAFEQPKYTEVTLGDEEKFEKIFTSLVSVNQSLTPEDLEVVRFFVNSGSVLRFPDQIPFKENLCTLAAMGLDVPVKTVTDVLRIAVGLSGGDVSLPTVPAAKIRMNRWSSHKSDNPARAAFKFKKFKRSERRYLMGLLEKTNCDASEAVLKDQRWIRLGEILHPGEFKAKYPRAFKMFDLIRNQDVKSWYGKLNAAFEVSLEEGLKVLSERPGEFVRRLDWLLRAEKEVKKGSSFSVLEKYATKNASVASTLAQRKEVVLKAFKAVAKKASNKVLYEIYNHFEGRYVGKGNRSIMVKGSRKRTVLPDLPSIAPDTIEAVQRIVVETLISKFSALPKFGKVAIDEELKKIPMPTNMRSASLALRPVIRGQRTPIGNQNAKVIRTFVHWFDENGSIDIDLHGFLIGENRRETIGWNSNHKTGYGCFSGDIICRRGACAEYVDVNVAKAVADGLRYLVVTVNNFRGGSLESITDCVAGTMEREFPEANMNFVPATLSNCMRLTSAASTSLMCVVDLETREYIHLDLDVDGIPIASHQASAILNSIRPYLEMPKFSVYDLLLLHVEGRGGELVDGTQEKADTYFTFEEFSTSYVKIMEYMGV